MWMVSLGVCALVVLCVSLLMLNVVMHVGETDAGRRQGIANYVRGKTVEQAMAMLAADGTEVARVPKGTLYTPTGPNYAVVFYGAPQDPATDFDIAWRR